MSPVLLRMLGLSGDWVEEVTVSWRLLAGAARAPKGRRSGPESSVGVRGSGWFGGFRCEMSIESREGAALPAGWGGGGDDVLPLGRRGATVG